MNAYESTPESSTEREPNQTRVGDMLVVRCAPGIYNVANHEHGVENAHEHTYTVTDERGCTCPSSKYHAGTCKHEDAVSVARRRTDGGVVKHGDDTSVEFDATDTNTPADREHDAHDEQDDGERVTGPHSGFDKYGAFDHTFWRCEACGMESTDRRAVANCRCGAGERA